MKFSFVKCPFRKTDFCQGSFFEKKELLSIRMFLDTEVHMLFHHFFSVVYQKIIGWSMVSSYQERSRISLVPINFLNRPRKINHFGFKLSRKLRGKNAFQKSEIV